MPEISENNRRSPRHTFITLGIATLCLVATSLVVLAVLLLVAGPSALESPRFGPLLATAMLLQNALLLLIGLVLAPRGEAYRPRVTLLPAIGTGILFGLAGSLAGAVIALVQQALGLEVEEQTWILETLARMDIWTVALAVAVVLIAPLGEEAFFRRYLFAELGRSTSLVIAAVLSAATFALIHFNWSGLALYFVLGLTLAAAYARTGRLIAPLAGHAAHNALTFALALITARSGS